MNPKPSKLPEDVVEDAADEVLFQQQSKCPSQDSDLESEGIIQDKDSKSPDMTKVASQPEFEQSNEDSHSKRKSLPKLQMYVGNSCHDDSRIDTPFPRLASNQEQGKMTIGAGFMPTADEDVSPCSSGFYSDKQDSISPSSELSIEDIEEYEYPERLRKMPQFDLYLVCSEQDKKEAHDLMDEFAEDSNLILRDGNHISYCSEYKDVPSFGTSQFKDMEIVQEHCNYYFLYITSTFIECKWSEMKKDELLMESIQNPVKQWSVVPVYSHPRRMKPPFNIPFGLKALKGMYIQDRSDKYFKQNLKKLFDDRLGMKQQRGAKLQKERKEWAMKKIKIRQEDARIDEEKRFMERKLEEERAKFKIEQEKERMQREIDLERKKLEAEDRYNQERYLQRKKEMDALPVSKPLDLPQIQQVEKKIVYLKQEMLYEQGKGCKTQNLKVELDHQLRRLEQLQQGSIARHEGLGHLQQNDITRQEEQMERQLQQNASMPPSYDSVLSEDAVAAQHNSMAAGKNLPERIHTGHISESAYAKACQYPPSAFVNGSGMPANRSPGDGPANVSGGRQGTNADPPMTNSQEVPQPSVVHHHVHHHYPESTKNTNLTIKNVKDLTMQIGDHTALYRNVTDDDLEEDTDRTPTYASPGSPPESPETTETLRHQEPREGKVIDAPVDLPTVRPIQTQDGGQFVPDHPFNQNNGINDNKRLSSNVEIDETEGRPNFEALRTRQVLGGPIVKQDTQKPNTNGMAQNRSHDHGTVSPESQNKKDSNDAKALLDRETTIKAVPTSDSASTLPRDDVFSQANSSEARLDYYSCMHGIRARPIPPETSEEEVETSGDEVENPIDDETHLKAVPTSDSASTLPRANVFSPQANSSVARLTSEELYGIDLAPPVDVWPNPPETSGQQTETSEQQGNYIIMSGSTADIREEDGACVWPTPPETSEEEVENPTEDDIIMLGATPGARLWLTQPETDDETYLKELESAVPELNNGTQLNIPHIDTAASHPSFQPSNASDGPHAMSYQEPDNSAEQGCIPYVVDDAHTASSSSSFQDESATIPKVAEFHEQKGSLPKKRDPRMGPVSHVTQTRSNVTSYTGSDMSVEITSMDLRNVKSENKSTDKPESQQSSSLPPNVQRILDDQGSSVNGNTVIEEQNSLLHKNLCSSALSNASGSKSSIMMTPLANNTVAMETKMEDTPEDTINRMTSVDSTPPVSIDAELNAIPPTLNSHRGPTGILPTAGASLLMHAPLTNLQQQEATGKSLQQKAAGKNLQQEAAGNSLQATGNSSAETDSPDDADVAMAEEATEHSLLASEEKDKKGCVIQ